MDAENTEIPPQAHTPIIGTSQGQSSQPTSFEFVENGDKSQIRSHAMRESWKKRGRRSGSHNPRDQAVPLRLARISSEFNGPSSEDDPHDNRLLPRDHIFIDLRHTLGIPKGSHAPQKWKASNIPNSRNNHFRLYRTPSNGNELDPFNLLNLSQDDQALLFHCRSSVKGKEGY
jgi:hypothetical protein